MNNQRLLTGLLAAALLSGGLCPAQTPATVTLEEIFETAGTTSARLRPLRDAEAEARHETAVARSGRLPDINAGLALSYLGDGFTTRRNFSDYQKAPIPHFGNGLSLSINQPLYTGGAIAAGIELAELKTTAARYAADLGSDNLRFEITGYYLDIYKYTNLARVVDGNIAQARKVLAEMKARHRQGTALRNDITRYELLVSDLELQRIRIANTLDILNSNIIVVAGLPDGTVVVPDSTILARSLPVDTEAEWQQAAEDNAPSLAMARTGVAISKSTEKITRSEKLPKIGLQAGWTIDGPILTEVPPINRNLSYWYVGLGVSFNISSLYKTDKAVDRSRAATRRAIDELELARQNVSLGIRADYVRYREAYEELKTRTKSVELAERNYNTISKRYAADMALITDMLDAANARLAAEQQLVDARINIIYYYYKLLFTSGTI